MGRNQIVSTHSNSGYSIEQHKAGRFIVWRITEDGEKLRQGSFATSEEAHERMESSISNLS